MVKSLEISRRFFFEWGLPFIKKKFPDLVERIAAGLVTGGSDTIGADDKYSRDHGWGPHFEVWLTAQDFKRCGKRLAKVLNQAAPETFMGHGYHHFGTPKDKVDVTSIDQCLEWLFRRKYPPKRARDWFTPVRGQSLVERESFLYFLKHGEVFYDPLGEFSARRKLFSQYPQDVRLRLISNTCMDIWSYGEYKFYRRLIFRGDPVAIQICLGHFVESVMRLCFLLNNDFSPYWMWLRHEFKELPEAKALDSKIQRLVRLNDLEKQRKLICDICRFLRSRLVEENFLEPDTDINTEIYGLGSQAVERKIQDRILQVPRF